MADEEVKTTCAFFVKRKARFCRMRPTKGRRYCGEHLSTEGEDEVAGRKRIPCPLDPKHTVYEDILAKHIRKCNVKKKTDVVYYSANINSGIENYEFSSQEKVPLNLVPQDQLQQFLDKVNVWYNEHCPKIEEKITIHQTFEQELSSTEYGSSVLKHLKQQASLIGHLAEEDLLQSDTIYVEFGAGRGKLSHWLQKALGNSANNVDFVLIDRASNRYKADSYHKGKDQGPSFQRVLLDIEHLNLGRVPCVEQDTRQVTAISKHLCGAATDLSLRCLLETLDAHSTTNEETSVSRCDKERPRKRKFPHEEWRRTRAVVFALCCHHRCNWPHYVGRPFMEQLGCSPAEFHLLCCVSSWAVCAIRPRKPDTTSKERDGLDKLERAGTLPGEEHGTEEHGTQEHITHDRFASLADREELGRKCKRLLDVGRMVYLQSRGFHVKLAYYIDPSVSKENVVLIAKLDSTVLDRVR